MVQAAFARSALAGADGGAELGDILMEKLAGTPPDALIVFATPDQDHAALLRALRERCRPGTLVGCSSAGEFTSEGFGVGSTCAVALHAPEMAFSSVIAHGLRVDRAAAADGIVAGLKGMQPSSYRYRSALVLTDALAGFMDELVDRLTLLTGGMYRFFGGGAGDDARFQSTVVFHGEEVTGDAVVALEILSNKPIGIGVRHGWTPAPERMRVTEAAGMRLGSLNAMPAVDAFDAHAEATGQTFDHAQPVPFFLHNVLGVESAGGYRLRVPLAVDEEGGLACAADVPAGSAACIMATTAESAAAAAAWATRAALEQLGEHEPAIAFLFDCVATRLRLGQQFGDELAAVQHELGATPFAGFNTYGQIAQAEGQFSGFHNCTAVVVVLPR